MPEFGFNIAMSIRAYGSVSVEAETAEEARAKLTADFVADNFTPHGSGEDDLDYNTPAEIWCDGAYTEDGEDAGDVGPFNVPDGEWVTRDPVEESARDLLEALKAVLPYALSRIQDMNENPDEHSEKANAAYCAAVTLIEKTGDAA